MPTEELGAPAYRKYDMEVQLVLTEGRGREETEERQPTNLHFTSNEPFNPSIREGKYQTSDVK